MLLGSTFLTRFKVGVYFVILLLLVLGGGCGPQTLPATPTEERLVTPTVVQPDDTMSVTTRVECICEGKNIVPSLYIQPHNGTPPYLLPGHDFVAYQLIPANIGDILHITVWSSDASPLKWTGDITISCAVIPACSTASSNSSSSSSSSNSSNNSSDGNSSSASSGKPKDRSSSSSSESSSSSSSSSSSNGNSSSSSSSHSASSQSSSSSSSSSSGDPSDIPPCQPKPKGGTEPPGICKKKN